MKVKAHSAAANFFYENATKQQRVSSSSVTQAVLRFTVKSAAKAQ